MKQAQALLRYSLPEVAYLQNHSVARMLRMDARIRSAGVAMHALRCKADFQWNGDLSTGTDGKRCSEYQAAGARVNGAL
jgi:hypothetical protein